MLTLLDTENADRNLTSQVTVLTHTPDAINHRFCIGMVEFGDGTKNLNGAGGDFELTIVVGGQTIQPDPQKITFSTAVRAAVWTTPFPVPANAQVLLKAKSPNAGDTDVDVTARLYDAASADIRAVAGDPGRVTQLSHVLDGVYWAPVVDDVANSASTFELDISSSDDYFHDAQGGAWLTFVNPGSFNYGLTRRITDYNNTTHFVTVEPAFPNEPTEGDIVIIHGREYSPTAIRDAVHDDMVLYGTVESTGASTTIIPIKTLSITLTVTDQLKGRVIIFDDDTTTAALRGQGAPINGNSTTQLTLDAADALTTTPAEDDSFRIV